MRLKSSVTKKITAAIIAMMVVFIVFLSAFCLGLDAGHDCSGEDCPICDFMRQCENTLRGFGEGIAQPAVVLLPFIPVLFVAGLFASFASSETLVSRKIRLNN
jgi:hypothetical protein